MTTRSLEDAFARFRDERDLASLAEVFDRTAPELLEVARHLARRRGEAEDLVQATFLAALERAERFEPGRALVPWLLGILVNLARRARERRGAVGEPSAELADTRAPDPAARAAESEFRLALEGALARLPLTYREVLASHLGEGQAPEEIARRLGRAPGTVRVQLHRAFEHLRRLLPAGFALGALGLLSTRGLAAVRAEVLRAASGGRAPLATTLTIGGGLMGKKLALVALVLLGAGSAWWLASRGERAEPAATVAAATTATELATPPRIEVASREPAPNRIEIDGASAGTEKVGSEPYGSLAVELRWWDDTPAAELALSFVPWGEPQPEQTFQLALTDEQGRAQARRFHEGQVTIDVERLGNRGSFPADVRRGETSTERITLPRGCDVIGRVLDARGAPAGGASIWVKQELMQPAHLAARAQADGSFLVRSVPEGFGVLATADRGGSSDTATWEHLEVVDSNTRRAELHLRGESAELQGRVTDARGERVGGARISIFCANDSAGHELRRWPHLRVAGGADGEFFVGGLHRGRVDVRIAAPGFAPWHQGVTLDEDRTTPLAVVLDEGFSVHGSVALLDGTVVPGVNVRVKVVDYRDPELWTIADDAGRYLLEHVAAGEVVLVVSEGLDEHGRQAQKRMTGRAGQALTWDVVFGAGPAIRGSARDEAGRALAGWRVQAWPTSGTQAARSAEIATDEQGAFRITDLVDTPYDVVLYAPEDVDGSRPLARAENLLAGGPEIELVLHGERAPSAFLSGRVLDPDGKPVRPSNVWANREDGLGSLGNPAWSEGERFRLGPMLAGAYQLSLTVAGFPGTTLDLALAEGEERDLGDIALPRPGRVELTLRDRDGQPIAQPMSVFLQEAGRFVHQLTSADGLIYESDALFPGSYGLRIMSGAFTADQPVSIDVRAGETTTMELNLSPARNVTLEPRVPEGEPLPRRTRCELRDAGGALLAEFEVGRMVSPGTPDRLGENCALPFGPIRYSIRSADGWHAAGEFEVSPGESWSQWETILLAR